MTHEFLSKENAVDTTSCPQAGIMSLRLDRDRLFFGVVRFHMRGDRSAKEEAKLRLAQELWNRACLQRADCTRDRRDLPVELSNDRLGRPRLVVDGREHHSISFTRLSDLIWGALSFGTLIGIDAADSRDFEGQYPFQRAFHEDEVRQGIMAGARGVSEAAALMWSAKEAAVKAIGVGFHLIDPKEVRARIARVSGERSLMRIDLGCRIQERNWCDSEIIKVRACQRPGGWISIALASRCFPGVDRRRCN
jgi:phosphopantetheinyl transferase